MLYKMLFAPENFFLVIIHMFLFSFCFFSLFSLKNYMYIFNFNLAKLHAVDTTVTSASTYRISMLDDARLSKNSRSVNLNKWLSSILFQFFTVVRLNLNYSRNQIQNCNLANKGWVPLNIYRTWNRCETIIKAA